MSRNSLARAKAADRLLELVVRAEGVVILKEALRPGLYTLGMSPSTDLQIVARGISAHHAFLRVDGGRAAIQAAGDATVRVNGTVVRSAWVEPGDDVQCGAAWLRMTPMVERVPSQLHAMPAELDALLGRPKPVSAPVRDERGAKVVVEADDGERSNPDELTRVAVAPSRPSPSAPPRKSRPAPSPSPEGGELRLYSELYWGAVRRDARSFAPSKRPVLAAASDGAALPLWGFSLPAGAFELAQSLERGFRIFIPPNASVDRRSVRGWHPLEAADLRMDGGRRYLSAQKGEGLRLREGGMSLVLTVGASALPLPRLGLGRLPKLPLGLLAGFLVVMGIFVSLAPSREELAEHAVQPPPAVAVRLLVPEKPPEKKKEKKEEKEKVREREEGVVKRERGHRREVAPPPPASAKAMKALAKLAAAGPAMGDLMARMDKLGSGPGAKNLPTLSGMLGNAPTLNAGLGAFGLGGGGRGGSGVRGAELLRGRGGGGIGAFGARGYGAGGRVGGTVARASARAVAVQGSIDREAVARVVNAHLQEVRACYERALLKSPGLAGKVVLEWQINTSGRVTAAKSKSSTLRDGAVEGCMLLSLKGWQFPQARGGLVIVSYPFLFNSVGY